VQLAGPWTLAAALELPRGGKALGDPGAVRDLVGSLAETVSSHLEQVRRRVPAASLLLQLDEPTLPAVLGGAVPTASGMATVRVVDQTVASAALREVVQAAGVPVVVHCCAADVPFDVLHAAGATAVAFDLAAAHAHLDTDALAERVELGLGLWLGIVPALGPGAPPTVREVLEPARELCRRLDLTADRVVRTVTVTPACGLAGASEGWARTALRLTTQAARALMEAAA
jgi:methionine synthase II (cobalamin-independent)